MTLGVGLVFELPVLIFLLTLLHVLSPRFLLRHSRYAILIIVIAAAIITPTPDVFNLMLFAIPMCALYFVGVFLGYLIVLRREGQRFPWRPAIRIAVDRALVVPGHICVVCWASSTCICSGNGRLSHASLPPRDGILESWIFGQTRLP